MRNPVYHFLSALLVFITITAYSQNQCISLREIVPTNKKIYMIGEYHLDHLETTDANVYLLEATLRAEDSIRRYLVEQCGVRRFMMEAPVSFEYFINQYIKTGDTSWIDIFSQQPYQNGKLKSIRALAKSYPDISVSCIDLDYDIYAYSVLLSLYAVTFYEPYKELYAPPYSEKVYDPPYNNFNLGEEILQLSPSINDTLAPLFSFFISELINMGDSTKYYLYYALDYCLRETAMRDAMMKYYGNNFDYVVHLMHSYYDTFGKPFGTGESLVEREDALTYTIQLLMKKNPSDIVCIQMGAMHTSSNPEYNMTRYRLSKSALGNPFSFTMLQQRYCTNFLTELNPKVTPDFNYSGTECIQLNQKDEVYILIK